MPSKIDNGVSPFPDPHRVVSGHNEKGEAVILKNHTCPRYLVHNDEISTVTLWKSDEWPLDCSEPMKDPMDSETAEIAPNGGLIMRM
jgi:hypothetical protein